jgi:hypothetical protein
MKKERKVELLLEGFKAEVKDILMNFDEIINAKLGDTVTITTGNEVVTRKATLQDTVELYESEWANTVELLDEIGINLEGNKIMPINSKINVEEGINKSHYKVYEELVKCMKLSGKEEETPELEFKGAGIKYDAISIEDNGTEDSIIILYRDGVNHISARSEVARLLLKANKTYEVKESSGKGYYPELIER